MKKWLYVVVMVLFAGSALASTTTASAVPSFTLASHDLSMQYLSELFGSVPHVLTSSGSQLMGRLFYVFNFGVLAVAGIWLAYTAFTIFTTAAADGAISTPQRKTWTIFPRLALGLALLVPNASGYSNLQTLVMQVVVQGVKVADTTWNYALHYIHDGGTINVTPTQSGDSAYYEAASEAVLGANAIHGTAATASKSIMANVFSDEVCMDASNAVTHSDKYHMIVGPNNEYLYFPGVGGSKSSCGSATINIPKMSNKLSGNNKKLAYTLSMNALVGLANQLAPVANEVAQAQINNSSLTSSQYLQLGDDFTQGAIAYATAMSPLAHLEAQSESSAASSFWKRAQETGWFDAGLYYWDLYAYNDNMVNKYVAFNPDILPTVYTYKSSADSSSQVDQVQNAVEGAFDNIIYGDGPFHQTFTSIGVYYNGNGETGKNVNSMTTPGAVAPVQGSPITYALLNPGSYDSNMIEDVDGIVQGGLAHVAGQLYQLESQSSPGFTDPMYFIEQLGRSCLNAAGDIWSNGADAIYKVAIVAGICSSMSPAATSLSAMMSWMQPLYVGAGLGLFVAGFMLTFYAPLYPFILFTFGALSWLLYVVEAMAAAPLVALGMTHPEGHDFLGRAEQALMLLLGVFIRPVLMVIGLLVGMMMSYISFSVINYGFSQVLAIIFGGANFEPNQNYSMLNSVMGVVTGNGAGTSIQGNAFTGYDLTDMLLIPLLVIFYGIIVIEVVNFSFSTIHMLPDTVLKWIGGPVQQDRTEQIAQKIGSQVSGAAKQVGELGGSSQINGAKTNGGMLGDGLGNGVVVAAKMAGGGE